MALTYTSAIAALLNNGSNQVLPISMANLIELAANKEKFGTGAQSVQDALGYLAGSFAHANNAAQTAQANAYAYVGQEINKLDVNAVGSATDAGHDKFISYIYQENGYIHAFAQDMTAANVAYVGDGRTTVAAELAHINSTIANNLTATALKLVNAAGEAVANNTVIADGTEYQLKQGDNVVAKFNIEKDSFVKNGAVVRGTADEHGNFTGEDPNGKYFIKLEIRTNDEGGNAERTLYIPAESLVDAYKADNADKNVTVTVNQDNNTISAVIKAGGVGTTELADSAVTNVKIANDAVETAKIKDAAVETAKIADSAVTTVKIANDAVETAKIKDGNVTLAKLANDVKDSLGKADSAVQTITEGKEAGTIAVDGKDVKVKDIKAIATTGAAADVSVNNTNNELTTLAGDAGAPTQVQAALELIAGKVNAINSKTYVNSVQGQSGTNDGVELTFETTTTQTGVAVLQIKHSLGNTALLHYDSKTTTDGISEAFFNAVIGA